MIEVLLQIPRARHRDVFLEPLLQSMFVVSSPQMRSEMNHQDSLIAMLKADIKECRGREMHKMKELKSAKNQLTQAAYQRTKLRQEISMLKRAAANEQNESDERVASASDARSSTGTEPLLQSIACIDVEHKC